MCMQLVCMRRVLHFSAWLERCSFTHVVKFLGESMVAEQIILILDLCMFFLSLLSRWSSRVVLGFSSWTQTP